MAKKILHIITSTDVGGAEGMLFKYLSNSNRNLLSHHVVSLTGIGKTGLKIKNIGIPIYTISTSVYSLKGLKELYCIFKTIDPEILQSWLYRSDFFSLFLKIFKPKVILCWNIRAYKVCNYMKTKKCFLIRLLALFSKIPKVIIINSTVSLEYHKKIGYHPRRWKYIPNGFDVPNYDKSQKDLSKFKRKLKIHKDTMIIGMVARFSIEKDHLTFLKACSLIKKMIPDVHYILVARKVEKSNKELSSIIKKLHLEKNVHLLGEREDIHKITSYFDIACSSSIDEAFPNVIGEAMSSSVPCVVTDVGNSAKLVGDTGLIVEPKNPKQISDACIKLLNKSKNDRQKLGLKARQRIINHFSIHKISSQYDQVYKKLKL